MPSDCGWRRLLTDDLLFCEADLSSLSSCFKYSHSVSICSSPAAYSRVDSKDDIVLVKDLLWFLTLRSVSLKFPSSSLQNRNSYSSSKSKGKQNVSSCPASLQENRSDFLLVLSVPAGRPWPVTVLF